MKRKNDEESSKHSKRERIVGFQEKRGNTSKESHELSKSGLQTQGPSFFLNKKSHQLLRREDDAVNNAIESLTKYTWDLYQVSPWTGFEESEVRFKQYSMYLRNYLSALMIDDVEYKADFSVIDDFKQTAEDMAVKIEVSCCKDKCWKIIYGGIFLSWGLVKVCPEPIKYMPLLLCRGMQSVKHMVHNALQKLFDCIISQYIISHRDFIWLNGLLVSVSTAGGRGEKVIKLVLRPPWKDDLRIEYKLILEDARALWNKIHPEDSDLLAVQEVRLFYDSLIHHITQQFKISLKDFRIDRITYPNVGLTSEGRFKCKDVDVWNELLHILCGELHLIDVSKLEFNESI